MRTQKASIKSLKRKFKKILVIGLTNRISFETCLHYLAEDMDRVPEFLKPAWLEPRGAYQNCHNFYLLPKCALCVRCYPLLELSDAHSAWRWPNKLPTPVEGTENTPAPGVETVGEIHVSLPTTPPHV